MGNKIYLFSLVLLIGFQPYTNELKIKPPKEWPNHPSFQHKVSVILKLVQIYVTDKKGNPVTDLIESDFELQDNGKPVKITEFEKHTLYLPSKKSEGEIREEKPTETLVPPARITRKFLLFFDFAFNEAAGILKAKKAALDFIDFQVHLEDEIGIMSYDVFKGLTLHEYFTDEHDKIREVIRNFGINKALGRAENITKDYWAEFRYEYDRGEVSLNAANLRIDSASENIYKNQVKNLAKQMSDLAKALRYIPGTKHIVFFSEGVANVILYGERMPKTTGGRIPIHPPESPKQGDLALRDMYEVMCKELAASNSLVYPVNTAGKGVSHFRSRDSMGDFSLRKMAQLSGGHYFDNISNYKDITEKIQSITSCYYVLGYYIDEKSDGKYHKLKLEVKRKGCQVLGQQGYFNPKPFSASTKMEKMLQLIDLALAEKPLLQEPYYFSLITLPFAHEQKANCMAVTLIPGERIKEISGTKMEVVTLFFDSENNIADMQKSEISNTSLTEDNVYFYSFSALPLGNYECRIVIRNMETGQGAVAFSSLIVPELEESKFKLLPPLMLAHRKDAKYIKGTNQNQDVNSLKLTDIYLYDLTQYVPIVKELCIETPKIWAFISCITRDIDDPKIRFSGYLLNVSSDKKIPISPLIISQTQGKDSQMFLLELSLGNLLSGEYLLQICATEAFSLMKSQVNSTFMIK